MKEWEISNEPIGHGRECAIVVLATAELIKKIPRDAVKGVTFQDPAYVEMVTGKVVEIDKSTWTSDRGNAMSTQSPVWDGPMLLAEREQVNLRKGLRP